MYCRRWCPTSKRRKSVDDTPTLSPQIELFGCSVVAVSRDVEWILLNSALHGLNSGSKAKMPRQGEFSGDLRLMLQNPLHNPSLVLRKGSRFLLHYRAKPFFHHQDKTFNRRYRSLLRKALFVTPKSSAILASFVLEIREPKPNFPPKTPHNMIS